MKRQRFELVYGGQLMMFVNDTPSSIMLTEPHGEAELEVGLLAIALDVDAMPDSRCKGHIVSGCDLYILKVEHNRFCGRGEESLPGRHIGIYPARQKGRRYIEHQYLRVMVSTYSR